MTRGKRGQSHLTCWTKQSGGGEENWKKEKRKRGKKREEEGGERNSTFSLDFSVITLLVWVGARGKVGPRIECYAWVPKFGVFAKL